MAPDRGFSEVDPVEDTEREHWRLIVLQTDTGLQ